MRRQFNSSPSDLFVAVGPSIRVCCYEVGQAVMAAFSDSFPNARKFFLRAPLATPALAAARPRPSLFAPGFTGERRAEPSAPAATPRAHLDLVAVARDQLRHAGVHPTRVYIAEFCTACRTDLFYSHRREGPQTGRMMAVIGIRPS